MGGRAARLAAVAALAAAVVGALAPAAPARTLADVPVHIRNEAVEAMRAYLDPSVEFLWRPRKDLLKVFARLREEAGIDPLQDLEFLQDLTYQGRHFLPDFADRKWLEENAADYRREEGLFQSVTSEAWRFTWTLPPGCRPPAMRKSPRPGPWPLLLSIHEEADTRNVAGEAERHPGRACLERRYGRGGPLYDRWMTLAPVASRGRFLDESGAIRHALLTAVVTEFWRRYPVDFDRIVVDGADPALALAAAYPHVLAGVVLRGGRVEPWTVRNYAAVPVYVVDDGAPAQGLAEDLRAAGHPDVTLGAEDRLLPWLDERRRTTVRDFEWAMTSGDHRYAHWVTLDESDRTGRPPTLSVRVVSGPDSDTVFLEGTSVGAVTLFLNDRIVDLSRPVRVILDGRVAYQGILERSFDQVFFNEPQVRKNMNFGWLYPVALLGLRFDAGESVTTGPSAVVTEGRGTEDQEKEAQELWEKALAAEAAGEIDKAEAYYQQAVDVGTTTFLGRARARLREIQGGVPEGREGAGDEGAPAPRSPAAALPADPVRAARLDAERSYLLGRPDDYAAMNVPAPYLGVDLVAQPDLRLPWRLLQRWWRRIAPWPEDDERLRREATTPNPAARLASWLLGGGAGPFPEPPTADDDPWPVLRALVADRKMREQTGASSLPEKSPLAAVRAPREWAEWWPRWEEFFLERVMRTAYEGVDLTRLPEEEARAERARAERAHRVRDRNDWLALASVAAFVLLAMVLAWGLPPPVGPAPPKPPEHPPEA